MIPDGLEPSLPGCRPGVVAAGPRDRVVLNTRCEKWTHRESHPNLRFAGPTSSCWTMSPFVSGSRGTRTHKRVSPATCFQDRLLIRPDDFLELRGLESNQRPPGSEPGVATSSNHPAVLSAIRDSPSVKRFGEKESNLHGLLQRQAAYH
jgi:hypothetical protein